MVQWTATPYVTTIATGSEVMRTLHRDISVAVGKVDPSSHRLEVEDYIDNIACLTRREPIYSLLEDRVDSSWKKDLPQLLDSVSFCTAHSMQWRLGRLCIFSERQN